MNVSPKGLDGSFSVLDRSTVAYIDLDRDDLPRWADRKGPDGVAKYLVEKNGRSLDGLPGLPLSLGSA